MVAHPGSIILCVVICLSQQALVHGGLEAGTNLFERLLHFTISPSALIRLFTGFDHIYQLGSSYREVAIKLLTLPFRDPNQHRVHFNGKERALGRVMHRPVPKHLDQIANTYRQTTDLSQHPQIHGKQKYANTIATNFHKAEKIHASQSNMNPMRQIPNFPFHTEYRGFVDMFNNDLSQFSLLNMRSPYLLQQHKLFQSKDTPKMNLIRNNMFTQYQVR